MDGADDFRAEDFQQVRAPDLKYPWEVELEEAERFQARQLEQVVEKTWKSRNQRRVEELNEQGLDRWLYRGFLRVACFAISLILFSIIPKLLLLLNGSAIPNGHAFTWLGRATLGNVDASTVLHLGPISLSLRGTPILGILDALNFSLMLVAILWFWLKRIPAVVQHPDVRCLSAADYAVKVEGLPARLADEQANMKYDFELVLHFETVLRDLQDGDPSSLVCEVALVRDYGSALLAAKARTELEAELQALLPEGVGIESAPGDDDNDGAVKGSTSRRRIARLRARIEALSREIVSARLDEAERAVRGAFVILGTEEERSKLLRAYRFAPMQLCGLAQTRKLKFNGRPLVLSPAPEPEDIIWAHLLYSSWRRTFCCLLGIFVAAMVPILSCVLAALAWWHFLSSSPCMEASLDCHDDATTMDSILVVAMCAVIAEIAHHLVAALVPKLVALCRFVSISKSECVRLTSQAATQAAVPVAVALSLPMLRLASRILDLEVGSSDAAHIGWYLIIVPVLAIWSLARWLGPPLIAILARCCCRGCTSHREQPLQSLDVYVSIVPPLAVALILQPFLPWQIPLAFFGLVAHGCLYMYADASNAAEASAMSSSSRPRTPLSMSLCTLRSALRLIALSCAVGLCVSVWVFSSQDGAQNDDGIAAWPSAISLLVLVFAPLATAIVKNGFWFMGRELPVCCKQSIPRASDQAEHSSSVSAKQRASQASVNFQEAWLIMTHTGVLPTFQMHDHPTYRGTSVLQELQANSSVGKGMNPANYLSRNLDKIASAVVVGDKPPTRKGSK